MVEIRDVARAYIACLQAEEEAVRGQIFNLSTRNYRISELALHVRESLREMGIKADIKTDYRYKGVRSYRVSTEKIEKVLNFRPTITIEESVKDMVEKINRYEYTDFDNPRYYNIKWMKLLEEAERIIKVTGSIFDVPVQEPHVVKIRALSKEGER